MITYRPIFIEPVVLEKIERDRLDKEKEMYNKPMEISIFSKTTGSIKFGL